MKISNPFQANNWKLKKLLIVVLSIQFAVLGIIGLDALNLNIPVLRELISFIYLTFVPGVLILRLLRLHNLDNIQSVLFTIVLSLATLLFTGFFMNLFYPLIGISEPISTIPVIITVTLIVLVLSIAVFYQNNEFHDLKLLDVNSKEILIALSLFLVPFLSIFGSIIFNGFNNNSIKMAYLLLITFLPVITLKWIPKKLFPLMVFVTSLSLLLHTSLVSNYIWGTDIHTESNVANLVLNNGIWDLTIPNPVNAVLSVTLLAPIYSLFLNMSVQWIYKVVYPVLFSFVPLGLFWAYKKLFGSKVAFLSCYFFMASFAFYNVMPSLARQQISELFLTVVLISALMDDISKNKRYFLLTIFSTGLILSHYGLSYVLMLLMLLALVIKTVLNKINSDYNIINIKFVCFFIIFTLIANTLLAEGFNLHTGIQIGSGIRAHITHIFDPNYSAAAFISRAEMPLFQSIERYLFLGAQGLTLIGAFVLTKYIKKSKSNINLDFELLGLAGIILALLAFFLPILSNTLQADRLYHILQFFLSLFFAIGAIILIRLTKKAYLIKKTFYIIALYLSVFFIFNSAFIYEVAGQNKTGSFALDRNTDFFILNDNELQAAKWLNNNNPDVLLYADVMKAAVLRSVVDAKNITELTTTIANTTKFANATEFQNSYIFLGSFNLRNDKWHVRQTWNKLEYIQIPNFNESSIVYSNRYSYIIKE